MKQFAIFGLGSFGSSLATNLYNLGHDVYAIDKSEELINAIADQVTYAVQADVTDIHALKSIGIQNVDVVIVALSTDLNASFLGVINAKELGVKTVYAKAQTDTQTKVLYQLGVDKVILPEKEMGRKIAYSLTNSSFLDLVELDPTHTLMELEALPGWKEHTLIDLNLRVKYNINVIIIKRGDNVIINPLPEEVIQAKDRLIVLGDSAEINKLTMRQK
ncbi:MAG: TrkA family potassium uptake protein [Anaerofustis sp.]